MFKKNKFKSNNSDDNYHDINYYYEQILVVFMYLNKSLLR